MAQRKQITWTERGWVCSCWWGCSLLRVAIFYITGAGISGAEVPALYLSARGGRCGEAGAPVRLDGVAIGNVEKGVR